MPRLVITTQPGQAGVTGGAAASVPISSVDQYNRLLLNGVPTFVISSSKADYAWFGAAGYSTAQQKTKIQELTDNGVTASMDENWAFYSGGVPPYNTDQEYTDFGWLAVGSFKADLSIGQTASSGSDSATITAIVKRFSSHAGVIGWYYNAEIDSAPGHTSVADVAAGVANAKAADENRRASINIFQVLGGSPSPFIGPGLIDVPIYEMAIGAYPTSGQQLNHEFDGLANIAFNVAAGTRFCPGVSATPCPELIGSVGQYRTTAQAEIVRFFWLAMAWNVRWIDLLWGPNQRSGTYVANLTQASAITVQASAADTRSVGINGLVGGVYTHEDIVLTGTTPVVSVNTYDNAGFGCATCWPQFAHTQIVTVKQQAGDNHTIGTINPVAAEAAICVPPSISGLGNLGEGMPVGHLTAYQQTLAILANLRSWADVWTDATSFSQLTTNPVFAYRGGYGSSGIYAAVKIIAGVRYIIACNVDTGGDSVWVETAKPGATITVGGGTVCTPMFGTPAPTSFSGGVITADFATMETKIFQVT